MFHNRAKVAAMVAVLFMTACSQAPNSSGDNQATQASTPRGPVSGKTAFWEMYKSAHSWAGDLVPLALQSKMVPGIKNNAGKAAMWSATFGSASRHEARTLSYSVASHPPDIYQGVTVGRALPWAGPTREALPFQTSEFAVDSDAAYKTALSAAAAWVKKHPDQEVSFALGNASRFSGPAWYVHWGSEKSGYAVFVNAATGSVIKN